MPRRRRRLYYYRSFLNRPHHHGVGAVLAEVELVRDADHGVEIDAFLEVADCSRSVRLDFSVWESHSLGDAANALRKARLLQKVVSDFADSLELALTQRADAGDGVRRR